MAELIGIARKSASRAPMEEISSAQVTRAGGLEGIYRGGVPRKRQVTVLSRESWDAACSEHGSALPWTTRRANLLVEGLALADTLGYRLRIGDVLLEVTEETAPCQLMDRFHQGLRAALTPEWRGGVTCRVLSGGRVRLGDAAGFE